MLACGKRLPPPATPSFKVEKTEKIKKNRGKTLLNFLFSREAIYLSRGRGPAALGRGEVKNSATALASGFGKKTIPAGLNPSVKIQCKNRPIGRGRLLFSGVLIEDINSLEIFLFLQIKRRVMLKKWFAIAVLLLLSASTYSQVIEQPGAIIGYCPIGDNFSPDLMVGGVVDISFNKQFSLRSGLEFLDLGGSEYLKNMCYLALPIYYELKIPIKPRFDAYILAGFKFDFTLTGSGISNGGIFSGGPPKWNLALIPGVGAQFNDGKIYPFIELIPFPNYSSGILCGLCSGLENISFGLQINVGVRFKT